MRVLEFQLLVIFLTISEFARSQILAISSKSRNFLADSSNFDQFFALIY